MYITQAYMANDNTHVVAQAPECFCPLTRQHNFPSFFLTEVAATKLQNSGKFGEETQPSTHIAGECPR